MDDLIALVAASDPMYHDNGTKYFTHDEDMIARGSIINGPAALGSEPGVVEQFTKLSITDRALIWIKKYGPNISGPVQEAKKKLV